MEPISNYRLLCPKHAPKSGKFAEMSSESFLGKFCKIGFKAVDERIEHMWVLANHIEDSKIIGFLNNDPILEHNPILVDGSIISFEPKDVEDILDNSE